MKLNDSVISSNSFFAQGIINLLSRELIEDFYTILDLDTLEYKDFPVEPSGNREIVGFASNDISFYRNKASGITILDKKSSLQDIFSFFLAKNKSPIYSAKRKLTKREIQVLQLLWKGAGKQEIISETGINDKTFYQHRRNIMLKLNFHNRIMLQSQISG